MDKRDAYWQVQDLAETLGKIAERDPDQEVMGMALPVLDAVITEAREALPEHPVVAAAREVVSVDQIADGGSVRAVDAWIVAKQLARALDEPQFHMPVIDGVRLGEVNDSLRRSDPWP